MSYSIDLRKSAVAYYHQGHSYRETGRVFGVSAPSVRKWVKKVEEGGTLANKPLNRKFRKLDPEKLKVFIAEHPDAYLREIAEEFNFQHQV